MHEPTSLFPSSWKSSFQSSVRKEEHQHWVLAPRPDCKDRAANFLQNGLESSAIFDQSTEDGLGFRIYLLGTLEIRTIQEFDGAEEVGAVFSRQKAADARDLEQRVELHDHEKAVQATQFVERTGTSLSPPNPGSNRRYYVVIETEGGRNIRMEQIGTGQAIWEPEPTDLDERNSLAKVIHSHKCVPGLLVEDLKSYQRLIARGNVMSKDLHSRTLATPSTCKRHAQSVFARAIGAALPAPRRGGSSFRAPMLMNSFMTPHLKRTRGFDAVANCKQR